VEVIMARIELGGGTRNEDLVGARYDAPPRYEKRIAKRAYEDELERL